MVFKKIVAAASAFALMSTPVAVSAQIAPVTTPQPASETVEGSELIGGWFIPLAVVVAIILGIILLTQGDEDEDNPPVST